MATLTALTNRLLVAGGFAVVVAAAPVVVALSTPAAPPADSLADECPSTEIADPVTGACQPVTDVTPPTQNPIDPEKAPMQPGSLTEGAGTGNTGELGQVDGVPCTGDNTGKCIGLEQSKGANNVQLAPVPVGVTP